MGVPALFRWLSTKYPKIVEQVVEVKEALVEGVFVPANLEDPNPNGVEFDNLYLDMNGIIHPCCHPENQAAPPTEQDMMVEIFKYIDRIFGMVRPRKILYLAIDGVAPRAKMNQQRSRRFRAAMEAELKAAKLAEMKESDMADEDEDELAEPFDSNCITPGTPFMALVAESLKFYTLDRINNHPAWKNVKVILSDASVPGEGEHKIMDFIRRQRLDPSYDPNTKHVIYGLDADLIMLSMATHEPHFKVLREDVFAEEANKNYDACKKCGKAGHWGNECPGVDKTPSAEGDESKKEYKLKEKPFIFLDVPTLREYLEAEMKPASDTGYKFEPERAIDDWIFMCFFVGNDFLPHLPSLEIREGAIDILIDIYKQNVHKLGGYICKDGKVDLRRVEIIMKELGEKENLIFKKRREKEERRIENAKRRKFQSAEAEAQREYRKTQIEFHQAQSQVQQLGLQIHNPSDESGLAAENSELVKQKIRLREQNKQAAQALKDSLSQASTPVETPTLKRSAAETAIEDAEPEDNVRLWEPGYQDRYYLNKFKIDPVNDKDFIRRLVKSYVEGLCWVMAYYYQGCPSWKWFFPYHYAPFAANLVDLGEFDITFELGEPFRPFDQLMGVFPAASSSHIPEQFRHLMTEPSSEVVDFYPETFHIDMNGKKQAWQGVALLPFIDEERLLKALEKLYPSLTPEQIKLNARGDATLFVHASRPPMLPEDVSSELILALDPAEDCGLAGYAKLNKKLCDLGQSYPSPLDSLEAKPSPILSNVVRVFNFFSPYHERRHIHFRSRILSGCRLPPRRLTEEDRYAVHSGAASRSFQSRLNLSGPSNIKPSHHSMHQEYNQRVASGPAASYVRHEPITRVRDDYYDGRHRQHQHQNDNHHSRYASHHPERTYEASQSSYSTNTFAALAPSTSHPAYDLQLANAAAMYPPPIVPSSQQPAYSGFHRPQPPPGSSSTAQPANPWAQKRTPPTQDLDSLYGRQSNRRI